MRALGSEDLRSCFTAEKETPKTVHRDFFFGPSYFVTALVIEKFEAIEQFLCFCATLFVDLGNIHKGRLTIFGHFVHTYLPLSDFSKLCLFSINNLG